MGYDERYEKIKTAFLQKRFYFGLYVFLPVFFTAFAVAAPLIFFMNFQSFLNRNFIHASELAIAYQTAEQWTFIIAVVAFSAGLIVAYGLVRPARKLLTEEKYRDVDEFSSLGKEFTQIAASLKKYTMLLENTTGGIIAVNKDGLVTMANPYACNILGCRMHEIIGRKIESIFNISRNLKTALRGESVASELNAAINNKTRTIGYTLSPIKGRDAIDGVVLNFIDITMIKEMHSEMRKTERLANIGSLAMEVAHEVRNPLASITGLVQLIGEDVKNDKQKKLYIDAILKETDRLNRVVDTIFEKKTGFFAGESLKDILQRIVLLCGHAVKDKTANVTEEFDESTADIKVHDDNLFHALYNIMLNAFEAVKEHGTIIVKAKKTETGTTIEISSDSEISPEIPIENIFAPDVTTKGMGHGMGLKIARDAIKNIGGDISVESAEGRTKFIIHLIET